MTPSMHLSALKASYAGSAQGEAITHDLERAFSLGREFGIDRAAGVVDACDFAAESRIRAMRMITQAALL